MGKFSDPGADNITAPLDAEAQARFEKARASWIKGRKGGYDTSYFAVNVFGTAAAYYLFLGPVVAKAIPALSLIAHAPLLSTGASLAAGGAIIGMNLVSAIQGRDFQARDGSSLGKTPRPTDYINPRHAPFGGLVAGLRRTFLGAPVVWAAEHFYDSTIGAAVAAGKALTAKSFPALEIAEKPPGREDKRADQSWDDFRKAEKDHASAVQAWEKTNQPFLKEKERRATLLGTAAATGHYFGNRIANFGFAVPAAYYLWPETGFHGMLQLGASVALAGIGVATFCSVVQAIGENDGKNRYTPRNQSLADALGKPSSQRQHFALGLGDGMRHSMAGWPIYHAVKLASEFSFKPLIAMGQALTAPSYTPPPAPVAAPAVPQAALAAAIAPEAENIAPAARPAGGVTTSAAAPSAAAAAARPVPPRLAQRPEPDAPPRV